MDGVGGQDLCRSPDWYRRDGDLKPGLCLLAGFLLSAPGRLKRGEHQKRTHSYRQDKNSLCLGRLRGSVGQVSDS